jgi:two-component sensor histidine kinase
MIRWRADFDLPSRLERVVPRVMTEIFVGLSVVVLTAVARFFVELAFGNVVPFALVFPAVVVATLLAGARSGILIIVICQMAIWYYRLPRQGSFDFESSKDAVSLVLTTLTEMILLWAVSGYRNAVRTSIDLEASRALALESQLKLISTQARIDEQFRLSEESLRETRQNLKAIYDSSADGLTLCRALRNDQGRVVEYQVIEVNKGHEILTSFTREQMTAKPVSQIAPPVNPYWFETAERALETGEMQQFDVQSPFTLRWLNIRVSRVSEDLFQQTFVDVTDRHRLEEQRIQMMKEMSHRVANNFQMMASFLRIQGRQAEPAARVHLNTAESRVQVLARLHALLAYAESDQQVDAAAYITELCDQLRGIIDRPGDVKLLCACQPLPLPADTIVPIGFIISELVTNATRYAFPPPATGTISVSLAPESVAPESVVHGGAVWLLTIEDNGKGMALSADVQQAPRPGRGLGTKLVASFVDRIGGSLTTTSIHGVRVEIRFSP